MTHVPDSLSSRRTAGRALADSFEEGAAVPSVQDVFLNFVRRDRVAVTVHLMTGVAFDARIKGFDRYAVVVDINGADHLVFKHAIAFIEVATPTALQAPHHDATRQSGEGPIDLVGHFRLASIEEVLDAWHVDRKQAAASSGDDSEEIQYGDGGAWGVARRR